MLDRIRTASRRYTRGERGASAVEYGLLMTAIAAVIAVVIFTFGDNVLDLFSDTCDSMNDSRGAAECRTE